MDDIGAGMLSLDSHDVKDTIMTARYHFLKGLPENLEFTP